MVAKRKRDKKVVKRPVRLFWSKAKKQYYYLLKGKRTYVKSDLKEAKLLKYVITNIARKTKKRKRDEKKTASNASTTLVSSASSGPDVPTKSAVAAAKREAKRATPMPQQERASPRRGRRQGSAFFSAGPSSAGAAGRDREIMNTILSNQAALLQQQQNQNPTGFFSLRPKRGSDEDFAPTAKTLDSKDSGADAADAKDTKDAKARAPQFPNTPGFTLADAKFRTPAKKLDDEDDPTLDILFAGRPADYKSAKKSKSFDMSPNSFIDDLLGQAQENGFSMDDLNQDGLTLLQEIEKESIRMQQEKEKLAKSAEKVAAKSSMTDEEIKAAKESTEAIAASAAETKKQQAELKRNILQQMLTRAAAPAGGGGYVRELLSDKFGKLKRMSGYALYNAYESGDHPAGSEIVNMLLEKVMQGLDAKAGKRDITARIEKAAEQYLDEIDRAKPKAAAESTAPAVDKKQAEREAKEAKDEQEAKAAKEAKAEKEDKERKILAESIAELEAVKVSLRGKIEDAVKERNKMTSKSDRAKKDDKIAKYHARIMNIDKDIAVFTQEMEQIGKGKYRSQEHKYYEPEHVNFKDLPKYTRDELVPGFKNILSPRLQKRYRRKIKALSAERDEIQSKSVKNKTETKRLTAIETELYDLRDRIGQQGSGKYRRQEHKYYEPEPIDFASIPTYTRDELVPGWNSASSSSSVASALPAPDSMVQVGSGKKFLAPILADGYRFPYHHFIIPTKSQTMQSGSGKDTECGCGCGGAKPVKSKSGSGLTSCEIQDIMGKYEEFGGVYPVDLIHTAPFTLDENVGIIYNTDAQNEPGEHWCAIYWDADNQSIDVYDSYAEEIPAIVMREIQTVMDRLKPETYWKFRYNRIKQQRSNSDSCGFFAMRFLIDRFAGKDWKDATGYSEIMKSEKEIDSFKHKYGYV